MAISENWANLLEPGLRKIFYTQVEALAADSRIPSLFSVQTSSKSQEHDQGIGGFGDWREYKGAIEYDDNEQLWKTTYTHTEFARGFRVERSLVDDDMYNVINRRPAGLALAAVRKREKDAASVFNNAFSSSYTGGDSQPLCESAGHPYSPLNASTQTNEGSTALSYDAVISTRQSMREFKDDRGELIPINPTLILIPPELEETASSICNTFNGSSPQKPGQTDYEDNFPMRKGIDYLVWDYLTDANNWFLIDPQLAKMYLNWFDRVPVEFAMDPTSDFSLEARYRGYMRYSYGWSDWRWVYGHAVT